MDVAVLSPPNITLSQFFSGAKTQFLVFVGVYLLAPAVIYLLVFSSIQNVTKQTVATSAAYAAWREDSGKQAQVSKSKVERNVSQALTVQRKDEERQAAQAKEQEQGRAMCSETNLTEVQTVRVEVESASALDLSQPKHDSGDFDATATHTKPPHKSMSLAISPAAAVSMLVTAMKDDGMAEKDEVEEKEEEEEKEGVESDCKSENTDGCMAELTTNSSALSPRVLFAAIEHVIPDLGVDVRVGGLGKVMGITVREHPGDFAFACPAAGGVNYEAANGGDGPPITIWLEGRPVHVRDRRHIWRRRTAASSDGPSMADGDGSEVGGVIFHIFDCPLFRSRTKTALYIEESCTIAGAYYYSAWNQCVAELLRREPHLLYHSTDYHGCLAPLYLLPPAAGNRGTNTSGSRERFESARTKSRETVESVKMVLTLHNAEYQGVFEFPDDKDGESLARLLRIFCLDSSVYQRYLKHCGVFNMLAGGAAYIERHQRGHGVMAVSDIYAARVHRKYDIFWPLPLVYAMPNPVMKPIPKLSEVNRVIEQTSETARMDRRGILRTFENKNNGNDSVSIELQQFRDEKQKAKAELQRHFDLHPDPNAEVLVFLGRSVFQKGVDIIADLGEWLMAVGDNGGKKQPFRARKQEQHTNNSRSQVKGNRKSAGTVQLVFVGPPGDLYGRYAAAKLQRLSKIFPGRIHVTAAFVRAPRCLFVGADFCLCPSRDEPFGYVDMEFAEGGTLSVGARVGGLGKVPGIYYQVHDTNGQYLLDQLRAGLLRAFSLPKDERLTLAYAARTHSRSGLTFPIKAWGKALVRVYEAVEQQVPTPRTDDAQVDQDYEQCSDSLAPHTPRPTIYLSADDDVNKAMVLCDLGKMGLNWGAVPELGAFVDGVPLCVAERRMLEARVLPLASIDSAVLAKCITTDSSLSVSNFSADSFLGANSTVGSVDSLVVAKHIDAEILSHSRSTVGSVVARRIATDSNDRPMQFTGSGDRSMQFSTNISFPQNRKAHAMLLGSSSTVGSADSIAVSDSIVGSVDSRAAVVGRRTAADSEMQNSATASDRPVQFTSSGDRPMQSSTNTPPKSIVSTITSITNAITSEIRSASTRGRAVKIWQQHTHRDEFCMSEYVHLIRTAAMFDLESEDNNNDDDDRGRAEPLLPFRRRKSRSSLTGEALSCRRRAVNHSRNLVKKRLCGVRLFHWFAAIGYLLSLATGQLFLTLAYVGMNRLSWSFNELLSFYCAYHTVYAVAAPFWALGAIRCSAHIMMAVCTLGQATVIIVPIVLLFTSEQGTIGMWNRSYLILTAAMIYAVFAASVVPVCLGLNFMEEVGVNMRQLGGRIAMLEGARHALSWPLLFLTVLGTDNASVTIDEPTSGKFPFVWVAGSLLLLLFFVLSATMLYLGAPLVYRKRHLKASGSSDAAPKQMSLLLTRKVFTRVGAADAFGHCASFSQSLLLVWAGFRGLSGASVIRLLVEAGVVSTVVGVVVGFWLPSLQLHCPHLVAVLGTAIPPVGFLHAALLYFTSNKFGHNLDGNGIVHCCDGTWEGVVTGVFVLSIMLREATSQCRGFMLFQVVQRQQYILGAGVRVLLNGTCQALGALFCVEIASGKWVGVDAPLDSSDADVLARGIGLTILPFACAQYLFQLSAARHYKVECLGCVS